MNATMANGNEVEDEYIWTVTLDKDTKEYVWNPTEDGGEGKDAEAEEDGKDKSKLGDDDQEDDEYDEDVHPAQRLSIKNAFLSGDDGKVHMVSIETLGYKGAEVKCPLVAMKAGTDIQRAVDMEFSTKVKLTLTHGEGPVTLVGTHSFDFSSFKDMNQTSILEEDDEDSGEEEEMEAEEAEAATNGNNKNGIDKKRKATDAGEDAAALKKEKLASPAKKAAA
eukprot:TRINITY_DN6569_c0_g1_i4.p1 TRINITY_DN6569_c0_g1~~TRINITY_DN6569_c0_g1_i4.p1  ORF type:complete len:222 (+),score=111.14 TRINITY_DN6569_c0_g1_i4:178-843(+)